MSEIDRAYDAATLDASKAIPGWGTLARPTPAASTDPAPEGGLREAVGALAAEWDRPGMVGIAPRLRALLAAHPAPETPEQVQGGGEGALSDRCDSWRGGSCNCWPRYPATPDADEASEREDNPDEERCEHDVPAYATCEQCATSAAASTGASEGLSEAERETLLHWLHGGAAGGIQSLWYHVERIVAARESAAATRGCRWCAKASVMGSHMVGCPYSSAAHPAEQWDDERYRSLVGYLRHSLPAGQAIDDLNGLLSAAATRARAEGAAADLLRTLDVRDEGADMVVARLLDSADRLGNPDHQGNRFAWPDNAEMLRSLARAIRSES